MLAFAGAGHINLLPAPVSGLQSLATSGFTTAQKLTVGPLFPHIFPLPFSPGGSGTGWRTIRLFPLRHKRLAASGARFQRGGLPACQSGL